MKRVMSFTLVLSMIFSMMVTVSAQESETLENNQWFYDGEYYEVEKWGKDVSKGTSLDELSPYVTYTGTMDDSCTDIAVFNGKLFLGFYNAHYGYFPYENGWAVYDMASETWSGKPEGIPDDFLGSPGDFKVINGELYAILKEITYGFYPVVYKTSDGVVWEEASLIEEGAEVSTWAESEINQGIALKIVPEELQSDYGSKITRSEFADLIVEYIKHRSWKTLDEVLEEQGVVLGEIPFTDTTSKNVNIAYELGIITGKGNGIFDPEGSITRQEAAVMLYRTYKVFSDEVVTPFSFEDEELFASWSAESIGAISALGVMNGTGEGNFSPTGTYTREQAFITIVRLYKKMIND